MGELQLREIFGKALMKVLHSYCSSPCLGAAGGYNGETFLLPLIVQLDTEIGLLTRGSWLLPPVRMCVFPWRRDPFARTQAPTLYKKAVECQ